MKAKTHSRDKGDLQKALRHPKLIWLWINGCKSAEISKRHVGIHLRDVDKIKFDESEIDPIELVRKAIDLCSRACNHAQYLYFVCRGTKPSKVVETGVHYGVTSAYFLKGLQKSGGWLYSIDLPNIRYQRENGMLHQDDLPSGFEPGFVVPESLRDHWKLVLGDSREKLPELLQSLTMIDLFHHDSMHTYDLMMFEFETAWPYIRKDGLLLADDADWNSAFMDFCHRHSIDGTINRGVGIARKR